MGTLARLQKWLRFVPDRPFGVDATVAVRPLSHRDSGDDAVERLARAERVNAAKTRLLATVSHEMRTPLNGILGMSHLLERTNLTAEQKNYLAGIVQSGEALQQLVADLLDFSTLDAGRFSLHKETVSPRRLVESVIEMLAHRAHEKGVEIAATISADVPAMLDVDAARLRQVLFNVIGNAVKFTAKGGVFVSACLDGDALLIQIRDSGPGMDSEEQSRLFLEFSQSGDSSQKSGGTGLGLAISERLMRAQGGSLSLAHSRKGEGSLFEIRLPTGKHDDGGFFERCMALTRSAVLLLAPDGPSAEATAATIRALGGVCHQVMDAGSVLSAIDRAAEDARPFTDIIVDHRCIGEFSEDVAARLDRYGPVRKIYLVSPEERSGRPHPGFDAWLIRPLREQTLVEVLLGVMRGVEIREPLQAPSAQSSEPARSDLHHGKALRVLMAEDDPVNATLLRAVLSKAGHQVVVVPDFDALRRAVSAEDCAGFDLIITDLGMPGGDGPAVIRYIRMVEQLRRQSRTPIIVLTGDMREHIRTEVLANGADLLLEKPVKPNRLLKEVQTLVSFQPKVSQTG